MAVEPTINPYAPPAADLDGAAPGPTEGAFARPMYSARQIGWAAFFGTIFAGVLLLQANFRVMGRSAAANKTIGLGFLATVALVTLLSFAPRGVSTPVSVSIAWAVYKLAESMQGAAWFKHRTAGGARRSNWAVFGVVVATLVGFIAVMGAVVISIGGIE
jgi:hypothetical protein